MKTPWRIRNRRFPVHFYWIGKNILLRFVPLEGAKFASFICHLLMPLFWLISFKALSNGHIKSTVRLPCFSLKVCLSKEIRFHRSPSVHCKPSSPDSHVGLLLAPSSLIPSTSVSSSSLQNFLPGVYRRSAGCIRFIDFVYLGILLPSAHLPSWRLT